jgi:hypothetical protein
MMDDTAGDLFNLEELIVKAPEATPGVKAPKFGLKAGRQKRGSFIQITTSQAAKLSGESVTVSAFFHLMFRSFWAYHKPFALPGDALEYAGINRFAQMRALHRLVKLELISIEHRGGRNPPVITIIGTTKRK